MAGTPQESQVMAKLDLEKYSLSHLKNSNPSDWSASDIEALMDAFIAEDITPTIFGLPFIPDNVRYLLSISHCRRCGKCCIPNPLNPNHPGVMVYKEDLIRISKLSNYSLKYLKKKAIINTDPRYALRRYLPFPCMFYNKKKRECQIYHIRPLICRTFPISDVSNRVGISINIRCDYGKDIYRYTINYTKNKAIASDIGL